MCKSCSTISHAARNWLKWLRTVYVSLCGCVCVFSCKKFFPRASWSSFGVCWEKLRNCNKQHPAPEPSGTISDWVVSDRWSLNYWLTIELKIHCRNLLPLVSFFSSWWLQKKSCGGWMKQSCGVGVRVGDIQSSETGVRVKVGVDSLFHIVFKTSSWILVSDFMLWHI